MLSCQDFANNAASFSACPGTKSNGGDLGEAQRDHAGCSAYIPDIAWLLGVLKIILP